MSQTRHLAAQRAADLAQGSAGCRTGSGVVVGGLLALHFLPAPPGVRAPPSSALLLCPPASGQAPPGLTGPVLPDAPRLCVLDTLPSMVGGWHRGGFPAPPWLQLPVLALPPSEPSLAPTAGPPRTHPEVAVLRVKDRGPRGREPRAWPQLGASHFSSHTLSHRLFIKHVDFQLPALGAARPGPPSCLQSVTSGFHAALSASPQPAGPQHQTSRRANRHTQRRVGCRSARSVLCARGRRRLLQRPFSAGRPGKEPGVVTTALSWGAHRWPRQAEGKPATGSAGGQRHPGLGLCLWRARPRAGLSGDCPLGQSVSPADTGRKP